LSGKLARELNNGLCSLSTLWNRQGSSYLRELTQQMAYKQQKLKVKSIRDKAQLVTNRHESTDLWLYANTVQ
jgi:hypothetical protein